MYDEPAAPELLDAVADLLRAEIVPHLDGALRYQARIAASLVALVARELRAGSAAAAAEHESLRALLGQDGEVNRLRAVLAQRIADRSIRFDDPAVSNHLRNVVRAKLAVDRPGLKQSGNEA